MVAFQSLIHPLPSSTNSGHFCGRFGHFSLKKSFKLRKLKRSLTKRQKMRTDTIDSVSGDFVFDRLSDIRVTVWNGRQISSGFKPCSKDISDIAEHIINIGNDIATGDLVSGAVDSLQIAQDIVDVVPEVVDAFVDSRTDAVAGGYADGSDIGFQ
jgi:hypothetical protein